MNTRTWKRIVSAPMKMEPNRVYRLYQGGKMIDSLKGSTPEEDGFFPEEWIGSVTRARNPGREHVVNEGLSTIKGPGGELVTLIELIEKFPGETLGEKHIARNGKQLALLVKFLDAAVRLPLQSHPDKKFAREHFNSEFGKTESWIIIGLRDSMPEPPYILFGFNETATPEKMRRAVAEQDIGAILSMLNKVPVRPGDCFLIRGLLPHAVGPGVFMVEIQEPTDFTISFEKDCGDIKQTDAQAFCGMDQDTALKALDYNGQRGENIVNELKIEPVISRQEKGAYIRRVFGPEHTECFGAEHLDIFKSLIYKADGSYVGIVIGGAGWLRWKKGFMALRPGDSFFVPAVQKEHKFEAPDGDLRIIACYPPGGLE